MIHLDGVAAQIPFRTPHRLLAQCMLHQRYMVVLVHMVGLSQVVPAWHTSAHISSRMQLCSSALLSCGKVQLLMLKEVITCCK